MNKKVIDSAKHILLDLYDCDIGLINSSDFVLSTLVKSTEIAGCKILNKYFHKFAPQGVTGLICVCESHFSIHTWPEYGYCAIDVFCCKNETEKAIEFLKESFKAKKSKTTIVKRKFINED